MKRYIQIFLLLFLPLLIINPLFQKLPQILRGNLLYLVIFLLFYKNSREGIVYGIYCGLIWDILASPAIGYYVATFGVAILLYLIFLKWIPYPSALSIGLSVAITHFISTGFLYLIVFLWQNHSISSAPHQLIHSALGTFVISMILLIWIPIDEHYRRGIS